MKKVAVLVAALCALLLAPAAALSQTQTVRGVVVEDGTHTPIVGALVELVAAGVDEAITAETNSDGAFVLQTGRSGSFVLRLKHLAYASLESDTLTIGRGETIDLEVRMAQTAIPLAPLVVRARRNSHLQGFYERQQRNGFGRFLTRADIERRRGARTTDLLMMMPGVHIVRTSGPGGMGSVNLITMRGGTSRCMPTIYLDGMEVKQFPESGVDDFLSPDALEGVEVYTNVGTAPFPILPRNHCGVVAFWTRTDNLRPWSWKRLAAGLGALVFMFAVTR